jgi:heptaprenyl diphosphate synthase
VTTIMARTIADLCQGQIREVVGSAEAHEHGASGRVEPDREHYLAVIGEKTASLIAASCRLGGLLSGQAPDAVEALTSYGWRLGMAFQLADDVLDIAGDQTESGKVPGTDLREGVFTLPVLLALETEGPDSALAKLLADRGRVDEALVALRDHQAVDFARDIARVEAGQAQQALSDFPPGPVVDGLRYLADYAVDRLG